MYRFLIVDDEYYIRQHIRFCIPWEDYGFQFAGEAANVPQALDFLQSNPVELMILDISMPGQSGIDLLKLMEPENRPHIIILTGFATFEYARDALKYKVADYLLKPVKAEDLSAAVVSLKECLDQENRQKNAVQQLEWTNAAIRQESQRNFFSSLYSGQIPAGSGEILERYGISLNCPYHVFVLDSLPENRKEEQYVQRLSDRQLMNRYVEQLLAKEIFFLMTQDGYGRTVVLLKDQAGFSPKDGLLSPLQDIIKEHSGLLLLAGYGISAAGNAEAIMAAYQNALQFFWLRSIYGQDADVMKSQFPSISVLDRLAALNIRLDLCLSGKQEEGAKQVLDEIFLLLKQYLFPFQALESEIVSLVGIAIRYGAKMHLEFLQDNGKKTSFSCLELIQSGLCLEEIQDKIFRLFVSLMHTGEREDRYLIKELVSQAAKIIDRDFAKSSLSLDGIAAELLVSPSYLSRSFSKIQGMSITVYLTKCRMEHAGELLKTTSLSIAQISEQCGYGDLFYFSRRFKAFWGIPPSKYRSAYKGKGEDFNTIF